MTELTNFVRDEDCPQCGFPETYAAVAVEMGPEHNPRTVGCRKCGWSYRPMDQILNPYSFEPIDFPDARNLNPVSMAYLITTPELADLEAPGAWEGALDRRWNEYIDHEMATLEKGWDEGYETGIHSDYGSSTPDGQPIEPDDNPYRSD